MNAWNDLVDLASLAAWMDTRRLGAGPIGDVTQLAGGTQNLLLKFERAGRFYVLRRPPRHPRPESNTVMAREARMLAALAGSAVPHPGLIAFCQDETALGAAFYLMEPIDGINAGVDMAPPHTEPNVQHRMGLAMVDAIVLLGNIDYKAVGLDGFGKVEAYLERQVPRWRRQLEGYRVFKDWRGPEALPGLARITQWLSEHCPRHFRPGIIHGDYHLGNVMFTRTGPDLAAVIDWELTTIGDPLIDLGWLIATWSDGPMDPPIVDIVPWNGFPKTDELIAQYARSSTADLDHITWYIVLACYKLGIILEGTYARASAGHADMETGVRLHRSAIRLFERALERLG